MASVTLTQVWLHDAADYTSYIQLDSEYIAETPLAEAPIRKYAGGRFRMVTIAGVQQSIQLTFGLPSRTAVNQLRSWAGRLLLLRDPIGRAVFGRFLDPRFRERAMVDETTTAWEADIVFDQVTHTVEV